MGDPLWVLVARPLHPASRGNSTNDGSLTTRLSKALVPASQNLNLVNVAAFTSGNLPALKTASNYTQLDNSHIFVKNILNPHLKIYNVTLPVLLRPYRFQAKFWYSHIFVSSTARDEGACQTEGILMFAMMDKLSYFFGNIPTMPHLFPELALGLFLSSNLTCFRS